MRGRWHRGARRTAGAVTEAGAQLLLRDAAVLVSGQGLEEGLDVRLLSPRVAREEVGLELGERHPAVAVRVDGREDAPCDLVRLHRVELDAGDLAAVGDLGVEDRRGYVAEGTEDGRRNAGVVHLLILEQLEVLGLAEVALVALIVLRSVIPVAEDGALPRLVALDARVVAHRLPMELVGLHLRLA